jgi:hypothetical protein
MAISDIRDAWTCNGCSTQYKVIDVGLPHSVGGQINRCGICGTEHVSPDGDLYALDPDGHWRKDV